MSYMKNNQILKSKVRLVQIYSQKISDKEIKANQPRTRSKF